MLEHASWSKLSISLDCEPEAKENGEQEPTTPVLEHSSPTQQLVRRLSAADRRLDRAFLLAASHLIDTPEGVPLTPEQSTVSITESIGNVDRTVGATLSYAVSMHFADKGLPQGRQINVSSLPYVVLLFSGTVKDFLI